jgi:hypothetical protein
MLGINFKDHKLYCVSDRADFGCHIQVNGNYTTALHLLITEYIKIERMNMSHSQSLIVLGTAFQK